MRSGFSTLKADKYLRIVLIIGSILSVVLVGGLFWLLIGYNHVTWGGDIDKTLIGVLGDFIGGIVGTIFTVIATFLIWLTYNSQKVELAETRRLVEQQLNATHYPHFALKNNAQQYVESGEMNSADHNYGSFGYYNLELVNIGNEPAKEVTVSWDYFNSLGRDIDLRSSLSSFKSEEATGHLNNLDYLDQYVENSAKYYGPTVVSHDYILPVTISESSREKVHVLVPYKLVVIFFEIINFYMNNPHVRKPIDDLGYVYLDYKNSLNRSRKQAFKLRWTYEEDFTRGGDKRELKIFSLELDSDQA